MRNIIFLKAAGVVAAGTGWLDFHTVPRSAPARSHRALLHEAPLDFPIDASGDAIRRVPHSVLLPWLTRKDGHPAMRFGLVARFIVT